MSSALHFLVIGAQRSGTTTLHRMLSGHRGLALPAEKEAPVLAVAGPWNFDLDVFVNEAFPSASENRLKGTVTPQYMAGTPESSLESIIDRAHGLIPEARLVAILRHPVERAVSAWRLRRFFHDDVPDLDEAIVEGLEPRSLDTGRSGAKGVGSIVASGEYTRILERWLSRFPREQLLVEFFDDLVRSPQALADRVFTHIGVPPVPVEVRRMNRSGTRPRLDPAELEELATLLGEQITVTRAQRRAMRFWMRMWNMVPEEEVPELSPSVEQRLSDHYRSEIEGLARLGFAYPPTWLDSGVSS